MIKTSIEKLRAIEAEGNLVSFIESHPLLDYVKYTKLHREVVLNLAREYGITIPGLENHDLDKFLTYWFYTDEEVQDYHWQHNEHHHTETTDENVLTEMVLDWASAPYTKPDKPLNAYDTLYRWYPNMVDKILPILEKYGLAVHEENPKAISQEDFEAKCAQITTEAVIEDVRKAIGYFSQKA